MPRCQWPSGRADHPYCACPLQSPVPDSVAQWQVKHLEGRLEEDVAYVDVVRFLQAALHPAAPSGPASQRNARLQASLLDEEAGADEAEAEEEEPTGRWGGRRRRK